MALPVEIPNDVTPGINAIAGRPVVGPGADQDSSEAMLGQLQDAEKALKERYANPNWFNVAAGFFKPQLGGFSASLGSASQALGENLEKQRANEIPLFNVRAQMGALAAQRKNREAVSRRFSEWVAGGADPGKVAQDLKTMAVAYGAPEFAQAVDAQLGVAKEGATVENIKAQTKTEDVRPANVEANTGQTLAATVTERERPAQVRAGTGLTLAQTATEALRPAEIQAQIGNLGALTTNAQRQQALAAIDEGVRNRSISIPDGKKMREAVLSSIGASAPAAPAAPAALAGPAAAAPAAPVGPAAAAPAAPVGPAAAAPAALPPHPLGPSTPGVSTVGGPMVSNGVVTNQEFKGVEPLRVDPAAVAEAEAIKAAAALKEAPAAPAAAAAAAAAAPSTKKTLIKPVIDLSNELNMPEASIQARAKTAEAYAKEGQDTYGYLRSVAGPEAYNSAVLPIQNALGLLGYGVKDPAKKAELEANAKKVMNILSGDDFNAFLKSLNTGVGLKAGDFYAQISLPVESYLRARLKGPLQDYLVDLGQNLAQVSIARQKLGGISPNAARNAELHLYGEASPTMGSTPLAAMKNLMHLHTTYDQLRDQHDFITQVDTGSHPKYEIAPSNDVTRVYDILRSEGYKDLSESYAKKQQAIEAASQKRK